MKLPRFTATTTPPRASGLARATDITSLTQTGEVAKLRGIGAFGRGMERVAGYLFKAHQDRQAIDAGIQHAKATSTMNSSHVLNLTEAGTLPVMSPAERKKFVDDYAKRHSDLASLTAKGIDNPLAKDMFRQTWETLKGRHSTAIYGVLTATLDQQQKLDKDTEWEGRLLNAPAEDIEEIKKEVETDIRAHLPLFGAAGVKSRIANLSALTTKVREDTYAKAVHNGQSNLEILTQQVLNDPSIDTHKIIGWIRAEDKVRRDEADRVLEAQQKEDLATVNQNIRQGNFDAVWDIIEESSLEPGEKQLRWKATLNERQRLAKGLDIITDPMEERRLRDLVLDIARDRIRADEVLAQLDAARTPAEGNPLINEAIHTSISNNIRTTLAGIQDKARADMVREVANELRVPEPGAAAIMLASLKGEEFNLLDATFSRRAARANAFEEALREWEKDNPKAQRDEYEQFKENNFPYFRTWEPGMPLVKGAPYAAPTEFLRTKEVPEILGRDKTEIFITDPFSQDREGQIATNPKTGQRMIRRKDDAGKLKWFPLENK
jgi:hypothetical protein